MGLRDSDDAGAAALLLDAMNSLPGERHDFQPDDSNITPAGTQVKRDREATSLVSADIGRFEGSFASLPRI